jgi:hypothetical protein
MPPPFTARQLDVASNLIMPPYPLHEQGTINNGKVPSSVLMPPLSLHEQGTTNNTKVPSFVPLPRPLSSHKQGNIDNAKAPLSLPFHALPLLTSLRKQRGNSTTLLHDATVNVIAQAKGQSSAPRRHCCYPLVCQASCPLIMLPPLARCRRVQLIVKTVKKVWREPWDAHAERV